jgi:flagellar hook-associated protein 2
MPLSINGLASGLDTESIVSQLMALEQLKVTAVQRRQITLQQHKSDLSTIKSKLDAVKSAAADLAAAATWKPKQATASSDASKVDVALLGGAGIGGHTITVERLASSAQHGFSYTPSPQAGTLSFYYGTDPDAEGASKIDIEVPANATLSDIATAINAKEGAPVFAAVIKDGGEERIVFSARKTGESSDFTVDTSQLGAGGAFTEIPAYARVGATLNASYKLNDEVVSRTSESNVIENAIPGVRLTLKGVTSTPVSVNTTQPTIDTAEIVKKITAFVDAYNAAVTATRAELTEKRVPGATTSSDLQKGTLFGDSGLTSMLGQLKAQMTQVIDGLGLKSLADIGIGVPKASGGTSTEDAKAGKLVIDTEKLTAAINADYTAVRDLFAGKGAIKGLSALVSDYVNSQTGTNGAITGRMNSDDTRLKSFDDQIAKLNERMAMTEKRLKAQFAAMESALNASQTQQAWLTSQIATLPKLTTA